MTFGEFLRQVLEWIYRLWPARIIKDWEQGVRCRFGNVTSQLSSANGLFGTGFHLFWPLVGEVHIQETNIEVNETELQTQTTKEGLFVTFSLGVKYRIRNLDRLYRNIHDPDNTIKNEICAAAGMCVMEMEYNQINGLLCRKILDRIQGQMSTWGIEIISLSLINLCKARPIRLITDKSQPPLVIRS